MRLLTWLPRDMQDQLEMLDPAKGAVLTSSSSWAELVLDWPNAPDGQGIDTGARVPPLGHRRRPRRTLWPAVVAALLVLAVVLIPTLAAHHRAALSATPALGSTEFVASTRSQSGAWLYSIATGQPIRQITDSNTVVGVTGDRSQVLVEAAGPPNVCGGGGADFQLVSIESGSRTSAFNPSEHVVSAAVGGDVLVGAVAPTSLPSKAGSCTWSDVRHAQIVVKNIADGTQRTIALPSELGTSPNQIRLLALSPDGRWAVFEDESHIGSPSDGLPEDSWQLIDLLSSPTNPMTKALYEARLSTGGGRVDKWAIARPGDCTTVTAANIQFTPTNNRLQVDFVCRNQMTLVDYQPATLTMVSTRNLTSPPDVKRVSLFSMHWNQSGSEALVRIDQHGTDGQRAAYSFDSRLYLYRDQKLDLITDTAVGFFFW